MSEKQRYWAFSCNPAVWDIQGFLEDDNKHDDYIVMESHAKKIKIGDLGVIVVGNDNRNTSNLKGRNRLQAGIYAVVRIAGLPHIRGHEKGDYWYKKMDNISSRYVVDIQIIKNMINRPYLRTDILKNSLINEYQIRSRMRQSSAEISEASFKEIAKFAEAMEEIIHNDFLPEEDKKAATKADVMRLEKEYRNQTPFQKEKVSQYIERGAFADKVKKHSNYECSICKALGLETDTFLTYSGIPYTEAHHVIPVSELKTGTLAPSNIIVLCAKHHRQVHYGKIDLIETTDDSFIYKIEGEYLRLKKLVIESDE